MYMHHFLIYTVFTVHFEYSMTTPSMHNVSMQQPCDNMVDVLSSDMCTGVFTSVSHRKFAKRSLL